MCETKTKINEIENFLKYTWMGIVLISGGGLIMLVSLLSIHFSHSNSPTIIICFLGLIVGCVISLMGLNQLRTAPRERKTDEKMSALSKGFEVKKRFTLVDGEGHQIYLHPGELEVKKGE